MEARQLIEMDLADTIIDRPHGFSVGNRHFYLYPITLGKMYLLSRLVEELNVRTDIIKANPYLEAVRVVTERKDICSRILTYHTIHTKAKIFDNEFVEKRTKFFIDNIDVNDMATLMVLVLTADKTTLFMKHLKIDKEQERMRMVMKVKKNKNNIDFGGLSVYGTLIDAACERYGWTFNYVVWEISYTNLQLMMADKVTSIYLGDEELAKISKNLLTRVDDTIKADSKESFERIKKMDWR